VVDLLSNGRLDLVVANGYVPGEFAMFDCEVSDRVRRTTETVATLKQAWTGEPFEFRGRTVQVTPGPYRPGGPSISLGGSSEAAARRAARIADGFIPSVPEVWDYYRDERQKLGHPDPGPSPIGANRTVALAEDTEKGWEQMAPFFLHEMNAYGAWQAQDDLASPYRTVEDIDELRAGGSYAVLTPDQFVEELQAAPFPFAFFHPMCGGMPIELAWSSLRLFEHEVMPRFE
jgi:alkanesulfonate monooxygenase SsuD/methylene tetrahydromethanopterin reductase-like flavin-dependent oxidoreductase (luciferase family)